MLRFHNKLIDTIFVHLLSCLRFWWWVLANFGFSNLSFSSPKRYIRSFLGLQPCNSDLPTGVWHFAILVCHAPSQDRIISMLLFPNFMKFSCFTLSLLGGSHPFLPFLFFLFLCFYIPPNSRIILMTCCSLGPSLFSLSPGFVNWFKVDSILSPTFMKAALNFGGGSFLVFSHLDMVIKLSLIHIWRCRRIERCRSRWSPYH